jgi:outer membrane protein assembly factor BamB
MKAKSAKLICMGLLSMLFASCIHEPVAQKQEPKDFPTLKMEKVFTLPADDNIFRPLTLQGNQYFYRDFDYKSQIFHYKAVDIDSKKIIWDVIYNNLEFPMTHSPQLIQDLVLFTSNNLSKDDRKSKILALDINNGSIRWQRYLDGSGNMTLFQKTLFVPSWSNLYALDFLTGKLLWSKSIYDFFPGYSKEKDYYHIDAFDSNQNTLFIDYILETDISKPMPSSYYSCLAIEPFKGSILWKYEKKPFERDRFFGESFEVIGTYLLIDGFTLVDPKNGKMLWQYKPEDLEDQNSEAYLVGYIASEQLLIYQYDSTLTGLDISTGQQKWKQEVEEKRNPYYFQDSYYVDQNHQTNQIFKFNSRDFKGEKGYQTLIDSMDVYDSKNGKLLQTYEMPAPCWFKDLKSEIRCNQGWWYFIGTSPNGDFLFRFQLEV